MRTLLLVVLLAGCATAIDPTLREARDHVAAGRTEPALVLLERASREHPRPARSTAPSTCACATCRARNGWRRPRPCARAASPRPPRRSIAGCRSTTPATRAPRAGSAAARHRRAPPRPGRRGGQADQERALPRGAGRAAPGAGGESAAARCAAPAAPHRGAHRHAGDRHAAPEDRRRSRSPSSCATCRCARCSTPSRAAPG